MHSKHDSTENAYLTRSHISHKSLLYREPQLTGHTQKSPMSFSGDLLGLSGGMALPDGRVRNICRQYVALLWVACFRFWAGGEKGEPKWTMLHVRQGWMSWGKSEHQLNFQAHNLSELSLNDKKIWRSDAAAEFRSAFHQALGRAELRQLRHWLKSLSLLVINKKDLEAEKEACTPQTPSARMLWPSVHQMRSSRRECGECLPEHNGVPSIMQNMLPIWPIPSNRYCIHNNENLYTFYIEIAHVLCIAFEHTECIKNAKISNLHVLRMYFTVPP